MNTVDAARAVVTAWRVFRADEGELASFHALTVAMELLASKLEEPQEARERRNARAGLLPLCGCSYGPLGCHCVKPAGHAGEHGTDRGCGALRDAYTHDYCTLEDGHAGEHAWQRPG